jgi:hypothetical protein
MLSPCKLNHLGLAGSTWEQAFSKLLRQAHFRRQAYAWNDTREVRFALHPTDLSIQTPKPGRDVGRGSWQMSEALVYGRPLVTSFRSKETFVLQA